MKEQISSVVPRKEEGKKREKDVASTQEAFHIRHSKSSYETYTKQDISGDEGFNPDDQEYPDLNKEGQELAQKEAENFFENLNPEKDILFFASSNEARALATADTYRREAIKRGFEIIKPEKTNLKLSDEETDGYVRMSSMLSLNPRNYNEHSIFIDIPESIQNEIADTMEGKEKERWLKARAIINNAPEELRKRGFGPVYNEYADQIKEIFPNVKSAKQIEKRFQNILKLAKWGMEKAKEAGLDKNTKILGFGHENYPIPLLNKYFENGDTANCEALKIEVSGEKKFEITKDGENKVVELE